MKILHVDSSPAGDRSFSRRFSHETVESLKASHPDAIVVTRDLVAAPLPHIDPMILSAFFSPPDTLNEAQKKALGASDKAVDELIATDIVVIGAPMYNFGIPSNLKAWIDHVVRANRTFKYTDKGPVGLLDAAKKLYVVAARGGVYSEGPMKQVEHQDSYLRAIFNFMGVTDITVIPVEGVAMGPDAQAKAVENAEAKVKEAA